MSAFADSLASVNAALNATSTVCLVLGLVFVRARKLELHRRAMWGAFGTSSLFLVGYLLRFYLSGTHRFPDVGAARVVYLAILFSHMILAVVALPLILRALYLATKKRFAEHRRIVRFAYPVWLYVSLTGVVVYVMLYHLAPRLV